MPKIKLTLEATQKILRSYGFCADKKTIADMIEAGLLPFGTVVKTSATGRRNILILAKDVVDFCESKLA